MGIDGDIIEQATKHNALSQRVFFHTRLPLIEGDSAYVEDSLTRVMHNPGPNNG
jgi:hypothetical protein